LALALAVTSTAEEQTCDPSCRVSVLLVCKKGGEDITEDCVPPTPGETNSAAGITIGVGMNDLTIFNNPDTTDRPTPQPTPSPSPAPTLATAPPSPAPTDAESGSGSSGSTSEPSPDPTAAPTADPTPAPTPAPTTAAPRVSDEDLCNFVSLPSACKCENPKYELSKEGEIFLNYDAVAKVEGVPCVVEVSDNGILTENATNTQQNTTATVCSGCIDKCCITKCDGSTCGCQSNVRTASVEGETFNVCHNGVVTVSPTDPDDCDDDTVVIIIVVVFGVLLLFVICVALYFCMSKKGPTELSTSSGDAGYGGGASY